MQRGAGRGVYSSDSVPNVSSRPLSPVRRFRLLDRKTAHIPSLTRRSLVKVGIHQVMFAPCITSAFFAYAIASHYIRHGPWPGMKAYGSLVWTRVRTDLAPTMLVSAVFWMPLQFVNFRFVPAPYRVLTVNAALMVWTIYLSAIGHRDLSD